MIHLNTAGAGLPAPPVLPAMAEYLIAEAELGPYEAEERFATALTADVYAELAGLVGADPADVALFGSATDAWCRIVCHLNLPRGSRVWVTPYEYAGNLAALSRLCARSGARLRVVPTLPNGDLDLDWMADRLDDQVALVSVPHMPSGCGMVLPVEQVGKLLAGSAAVYVVDACQTVGQVPVDVRAIGADLLTAAGRKFLCGPRGSGFAVVARRIWDRIDAPFHDLHVAEIDPTGRATVTVDTAARFETAERNNAAVLGLLAAVRYARTAPRVDPALHAALLDAVRDTPGARLHAPGSQRSGIVSFSHESLEPEAIRAGLTAAGINGWIGTGSHTPIYYAAEGVARFVRLSVHHYNNLGQIAAVRRALYDITAPRRELRYSA